MLTVDYRLLKWPLLPLNPLPAPALGAPAQQAPVIQELSAMDFKWSEAEAFLLTKNTPKFLSALSFQEVDYDWVEDILRKVRPMLLS